MQLEPRTVFAFKELTDLLRGNRVYVSPSAQHKNTGPKGLTEVPLKGLPLPLFTVCLDTASCEKYIFQTEGRKLCICFASGTQMVTRLHC